MQDYFNYRKTRQYMTCLSVLALTKHPMTTVVYSIVGLLQGYSFLSFIVSEKSLLFNTFGKVNIRNIKAMSERQTINQITIINSIINITIIINTILLFKLFYSMINKLFSNIP